MIPAISTPVTPFMGAGVECPAQFKREAGPLDRWYGMTQPIKPVRPRRISDQVFDQLRELIYRGKLVPGEQLMTERELARAMGVSRTAVRDAIQRLAAMGLIYRKQGRGTFVKNVDERLSQSLSMKPGDFSLEDLLEARLGLECNAAALAARRAGESDLIALSQSLADMEQEVASGGLGTGSDTIFHMAIAHAAKNPLHILIMRNIYDYLARGIRENLACLYEEPGNMRKIIMQHHQILGAIQARNSHHAHMAMARHITFVMDFFESRVAS